ncbi:MAG: hypothetical protein GAK35_04106 [Herbaspirillum frisingense]|uniref:Uncharacterized protein n=1 Tax=Herbaspirillum frisingense TaxID=92645 RepID=A0A7V8FT04_9BURK|nr:MAG: hypothetical protein GAK35_04106 [Herbaspirillum frisingense]
MTHPFSEPYGTLDNFGLKQGASNVALNDIGNVIQRVAGLQTLIESFGFDSVAIEVGEGLQRVRQAIATREIPIPRHIAAHTNAFAVAASAT